MSEEIFFNYPFRENVAVPVVVTGMHDAAPACERRPGTPPQNSWLSVEKLHGFRGGSLGPHVRFTGLRFHGRLSPTKVMYGDFRSPEGQLVPWHQVRFTYPMAMYKNSIL